MTRSPSFNRIPNRALEEYERTAENDWQEGVPLFELLNRINRVAVQFLPEEDQRPSRVKRLYSERSFRHYQTLGCIDPAEKEGRRSIYQYRHFVQALLVRKLLWERVPSEQIAMVMSRRATEETEQMFLGGTEMVAKAGGSGAPHALRSFSQVSIETWKRVWVMPGVELHLRNDLPALGEAELKELLVSLETALRGNLR